MNRSTAIDLDLFREEKGGNPEVVRQSQKARFKDPEDVDRIIVVDKEWRESTLKPHPQNINYLVFENILRLPNQQKIIFWNDTKCVQILLHLSSINTPLMKLFSFNRISTLTEYFQLGQLKKDLNKVQKEYAVKRKVNQCQGCDPSELLINL